MGMQTELQMHLFSYERTCSYINLQAYQVFSLASDPLKWIF
jgi:hypothetical protein